MSETFGNFLVRRFHEEGIKHPGKWKSLAEMAKSFDVKQSTFSTWCNDSRIPTDIKIIDRLAATDALGPEVYEVLGISRRMPKEPRLNLIASVWNRLPKELQDEWYEKSKPYAEGNGGDNLQRKATR